MPVLAEGGGNVQEPIIKYLCPVCKREYDTPEEAQNCYKNPKDRFKPGDIVWNGYNADIYRIVNFIENSGGAVVEHPKELWKAGNFFSTKDTFEQVYLVGRYWCRAELYPIAEIQVIIKDLKKRLKAAESFLKEVE